MRLTGALRPRLELGGLRVDGAGEPARASGALRGRACGSGRARRRRRRRALERELRRRPGRRRDRRRHGNRFVAGSSCRRRSAGILGHHIDRLVAAERTKRIAQPLVGARPYFAVAFQRRRRIDARPGRRRAGDLVEAGARIAEQFLLRHCRIGFRRIRRRHRRRVRRARLLVLVRRTCRDLRRPFPRPLRRARNWAFPRSERPLSSPGA